jgi:hypothetical protein
MANRLYHSLLAATVSSVSSQAAGYAGTGVLGTAVDTQWRTTGTSSAENIVLDLGSSKAIAALGINHCNFASASIYADNAATPTTLRGTLTTYVDHQGRRKGSFEFSAVTARYIRINMPGTGTTDAAAYFFLGFAAPFATAQDLPRDMLFGTTLEHVTPQLSVALMNGQEVTVETGAPRTIINCKFAARAADDIEVLKRQARLGPVWINANLAGQEYRQWPVRHHAPSSQRNIERVNREPVELQLRESA